MGDLYYVDSHVEEPSFNYFINLDTQKPHFDTHKNHIFLVQYETVTPNMIERVKCVPGKHPIQKFSSFT